MDYSKDGRAIVEENMAQGYVPKIAKQFLGD